MYHAGSWLGSSATLRPRALSTAIVWAMLISLPVLFNMPNPEFLSLLAALTLVSDCWSLPCDTMPDQKQKLTSKLAARRRPLVRLGDTMETTYY